MPGATALIRTSGASSSANARVSMISTRPWPEQYTGWYAMGLRSMDVGEIDHRTAVRREEPPAAAFVTKNGALRLVPIRLSHSASVTVSIGVG